MHMAPPVPGERVTLRALGRPPRTTALLVLSPTPLSGAVLATPRPAVAATPAVNGSAGKLSAADVPSAVGAARRSGDGSSNRTCLAALTLRYRGKPNYNAWVISLRSKARS
ncbi:hypothetical protein [Streptomyces sp. NPDC096324]|uniref:hypothetical protein n=1 Tax=Streptomyces sp. NPDC096324 TaxID=3366085 RepID=UPI00380B98EC